MMIRAHIFITDGMLTAARNAIVASALDIRGGGMEEFSIDLQKAVGGPAPGWNGASGLLDLDLFLQDVIEALNMRHNTGQENTQVATYEHEEFSPGSSPREGFDLALADLTRKPWILERVEAPSTAP